MKLRTNQITDTSTPLEGSRTIEQQGKGGDGVGGAVIPPSTVQGVKCRLGRDVSSDNYIITYYEYVVVSRDGNTDNMFMTITKHGTRSMNKATHFTSTRTYDCIEHSEKVSEVRCQVEPQVTKEVLREVQDLRGNEKAEYANIQFWRKWNRSCKDWVRRYYI